MEMAFFKSREKNRLVEIAQRLPNWKILEQADGVQSWRCEFPFSRNGLHPVMIYHLTEGFADDEVRLQEFKKALIDSTIQQYNQVNILFDYLFPED